MINVKQDNVKFINRIKNHKYESPVLQLAPSVVRYNYGNTASDNYIRLFEKTVTKPLKMAKQKENERWVKALAQR